jgi:hypothetical protein
VAVRVPVAAAGRRAGAVSVTVPVAATVTVAPTVPVAAAGTVALTVPVAVSVAVAFAVPVASTVPVAFAGPVVLSGTGTVPASGAWTVRTRRAGGAG